MFEKSDCIASEEGGGIRDDFNIPGQSTKLILQPQRNRNQGKRI
jgi:hypothetical protein